MQCQKLLEDQDDISEEVVPGDGKPIKLVQNITPQLVRKLSRKIKVCSKNEENQLIYDKEQLFRKRVMQELHQQKSKFKNLALAKEMINLDIACKIFQQINDGNDMNKVIDLHALHL